jgi:hypothetical protein
MRQQARLITFWIALDVIGWSRPATCRTKIAGWPEAKDDVDLLSAVGKLHAVIFSTASTHNCPSTNRCGRPNLDELRPLTPAIRKLRRNPLKSACKALGGMLRISAKGSSAAPAHGSRRNELSGATSKERRSAKH